jgi:hypothetical protein
VPPDEVDAPPGPASRELILIEQRATGESVAEWSRGLEPVELPGAQAWLQRGGAGQSAVLIVRRGDTLVGLNSPDLAPEELLQVAASLELLDLASGERAVVLEFAAIDNQTPTGYLPRADWSADGAYFNVAIPSSKVLVPEATAALYRVSAGGAVEELGSLSGSLTAGGPIEFEFSPDGAWVAYGTFDVGSLESELHLAKADGTDDRVVERFDGGHGFVGHGWSPDGTRYLYESLGQGGRIAGIDGALERFAEGLGVMGAEWTSAESFVYYAVAVDEAGLYIYRPNEPMRVVAGGLLGGPVFDVLPEAEPPAGDGR